jgi:hypothetical protein
MKKYLAFAATLSLITLSFTLVKPFNDSKKQKNSKEKTTQALAKPTCTCGTPTNLQGSYSGGVATLSWNSVSGAVNYSVGGYYSCSPIPPTFNFCEAGTSIMFSAPCGGTFQVTANCNGTHCTDATCSGSPSGPGTF